MKREGAIAVALVLVACDDGTPPETGPAPYDGPPIPWAYAPFPPLTHPAENPTSPEKVELGRLLFYDPILSGDDRTACATCHSEIWGMSDGLPVSVGVFGEGPTGPGRDGPNKTTRNAQTLWNAAFRTELFWDGRASGLEDQALGPLEAAIELGLPPDVAVQRLRAVPGYVERFAAAFPADADPVSTTNLARALSTFQRTLIADRTLYDQYVLGDEGALRPDVQEGMFLFAEAGCASCHVPPLFESTTYAARLPAVDPGRAAITGLAADHGAFRVPSLRNARDSEPYFHDGSVLTLEEAVAVEVDVAVSRGESRALTEDEVTLVAKFINKALTDVTRDPDRPEEVPSGLPVPEDGLRVPR